MEPIEGVNFLQGDFREEAVLRAARGAGRRAGRSTSCCPTWRPTCRASRAPTRPGSRTWSNWRSNSRGATWRRDGALVCKVFHGSGYSQLVKLFKSNFRVVKPIKPKASRDKSAETFLVGIGLKTLGVARRTADAVAWRESAVARRLPGRYAGRRLDSTKIGRICLDGRRFLFRPGFDPKRRRGEQSMVLEGGGLAGGRTGAVHRLQAVRPTASPARHDRLLRVPRRSPQQADQERAAAGRPAAAAPRSAPAPPTTRKCAPPPPTSTAAWSAT